MIQNDAANPGDTTCDWQAAAPRDTEGFPGGLPLSPCRSRVRHASVTGPQEALSVRHSRCMLQRTCAVRPGKRCASTCRAHRSSLGLVSRHDRKPGKQLLGSSIAGSANDVRSPWSWCEVGVVERYAHSSSPDGLRLLGVSLEHPRCARLLLPGITTRTRSGM
jgi:hypothetical protein